MENNNSNNIDFDKIKSKTKNIKTKNIKNKNIIFEIDNDINKENIFTVAETFVGCGGCHFGFKKSGYKSIFVNDIWEDAINTLKQNDKDLKPNEIICEDIYNINEELFITNNIDISNVDVFIGGVVCKGFSLAGIRNPYDERNYLYLQQLRLVEIIKPKISIIENVPGMLNMKILSKNNNEEINNLCLELNTICENHKKCRGKLIAENKKLSKEISLVEKNQIQNTIDNIKLELDKLSKERKNKEKNLEKYKYSVVEDIENIYNKLGYDVYKKILTCSDYGCFTNRQRLFIVAVRKDLNLKWEYPEPTTKDCRPTVKEAFELIDYNDKNNPINDNDNKPMNHSKNTIEKFKKIEAGAKSTEGYFSRGTSSRLSLDKPAPTLVPGHSAFQIHPTEHRSITVREGATITGFDTDFKFYGSHSSRCMQIGNAIPVTMAYVMAEQCKKILQNN
jgi:DNA (cytosine-5)-methyltransferase 1